MRATASRIRDWEKHAVPQRRPDTGCIPTGYEFLLRMAGIRGIDFQGFQEKFDLGPAINNFRSVAEAIAREYPQARFTIMEPISKPEEELRILEEAVDQGRPVLVSLRMERDGGWHIMPVLGHSENELFLLYMIHADGTKDLRAIKKWEFLRRLYDWGGTWCGLAGDFQYGDSCRPSRWQRLAFRVEGPAYTTALAIRVDELTRSGSFRNHAD